MGAKLTAMTKGFSATSTSSQIRANTEAAAAAVE